MKGLGVGIPLLLNEGVPRGTQIGEADLLGKEMRGETEVVPGRSIVIAEVDTVMRSSD